MGHNEQKWEEKQRTAPLYEALKRHTASKPHSFHVPGHKMGQSFDQESKAFFHNYLSIDMTEITGLDDLHQPEGVIAQAQELAAAAFDAEETKFLIGGTTVGNLATILTVCRPGDKIIVQRNCHKSVYHGMVLAQAEPIYVIPAVDPETGLAAGVRREDVERLLIEHPDAKAVFLTNPTYYGMGIDLEKMATVVHRHNIPLLIDEAHGAHYGFHRSLPPSAMQCGVDVAIQSTHKMGTAFTMCSMLHIQGERINRQRLYHYLAMLQSSSPSYPLMASLDLARRHMVMEGSKEWTRAVALTDYAREELKKIPWLHVVQKQPNQVYQTSDPLKLVLTLRTSLLSGYDLQARLEEAGIYPELADLHHVLLISSSGTTEEDIERLIKCMEQIHLQIKQVATTTFESGMVSSSFLRKKVFSMHEAIDARAETVPLEEATGRICVEMVIPYPPGIPLLTPGEEIDTQVIRLLQELRDKNARFQGVADGQMKTLRVVQTEHERYGGK
ncbi:aminotransferase class I/II-fold pyridoxal phosphate-dependent enzyme [Brevibacillus daliensis]|uniref:aminotransferase class I/II-fold pyridoxal phosphate-dependent enzyme n=1 Tax=Brevibacillus daliensis TaxID=2892995 RepID=UPI001E5215FB|nr:aminotransferase class I/II-fold pyridoxal phosphate-dependent enzyme [Brevibacillus daliensis]